MNRRSMLILAALTGLSASLACAADKPNFSGGWKLNSGKSDFGMMPAPDKLERTIKHTDPKMNINSVSVGAQGEQKSESNYTTDGKDSMNTVRGAEVKSVAAWEGDVLVIKSKREAQGMEITVVENWSLSADGKVLTVLNKIGTPQGDFEMKTVMDKQ